MSEHSEQAGTIQVLVERFEKQRLPRALRLKEKVDSGGRLDAADIDFLEEVFRDAQYVKPLVDENPEWQELAARAISLYEAITARALENEKAGGGG